MGEYKASVEIKVFDSEGQQVESPMILDVLGNYLFRVIICNDTITSGGYPFQAMFETVFGASLDGIEIIPATISPPTIFGPDQMQYREKSVYILGDWAGLRGRIVAKAFDPFGKLLASAVEGFRVGYEVSPDIAYQVPGKILASGGFEGIDMPYLNPDLDNQEGVVMSGVGSRPPLLPPPSQPTPIDYSKSKPPPGLDSSSEPEPPVAFEGETAFDGRLG